MTDLELVKNFLKGDIKAFELLFKKYKEYTFKISFHILQNQDDALDNVNNAWIKIYISLTNGRFKFQSKLSTWIYKIVVNEALILIRKKREEILLKDFAFAQNSTYSNIEEIEQKIDRENKLKKVLQILTPLQKEIVQLVVEGYSFEEIAKRLNIKPNYLYQLVSRIKKSVKNCKFL